MKPLYHYTRHSKLPLIITAQELKLADSQMTRGEKPVVWLTYSEEWEPTATPGVIEGGVQRTMSMEELLQTDRLVRIQVPEEGTLPLLAWANLSGVPKHLAKALYSTAVEVGAHPQLWRVSFRPIPVESFIGVEIWENNAWTPVLLKNVRNLFA